MQTDIITPEIKEQTSENLLDRIRDDFIGLNTKYSIANGEETRRIYLDSTASTLMMGIAHRTSGKFLKHYSNTHSLMHFSAKIATKTYAWVHERMLAFVHADPEHYTCFFTGSGTTSGKKTCIVFRISMDKLQHSFMNPSIGLCSNFGTKVH